MISRASACICLNGSTLGGVVPSRNGESADFGSISCIGSACRSLACDMWPSRLCHRFGLVFSAMFTTPMGLIAISGYRLLYLCPLPSLTFPRLIIHTVVPFGSGSLRELGGDRRGFGLGLGEYNLKLDMNSRKRSMISIS